VLISACDQREQRTATGYAQGTTYTVHYITQGPDLQYKLDSILAAFDRVLSTYQQTSFISKWNDGTAPDDQPVWFKDLVKRSIGYSQRTEGTFDITVGPLTGYFGFGSKRGTEAIDSAYVDSLRGAVGFGLLTVADDGTVGRTRPDVRLDVNAVAQGYSVDVIARMLEAAGITDHLVEIGGEIRAKGRKKDGSAWKVGIDTPSEDGNPERELALSIELKDRSMATSGNYRKSVEIDGQRLAHTIDPRTGYPALTDVLSATILAPDAATADAYATACMVMGLSRCKTFVEADTTLKAVLIYDDGGMKVWKSAGL
jgi:thiamine biosynthesis lipoprotein